MRLFLVVALAAALATGLIFDVPYYSPVVQFVAEGLEWLFLALAILVALAMKKWLSGSLLLVFVATLILGLLNNDVPSWIDAGLEWLALVVILGLFGFFFFMRDVHNKGKRKAEEKEEEKKDAASSETPKPSKPATKSSHGMSWQLLLTILVIPSALMATIQVVYLVSGSRPIEHRLPSVDFVSAPQVKTCPESETLAPGEISSTFENVPDGQNLSILPNLSEETVVIYMGSTGRLCGPETANTDRWCVKNISDKPVTFSCSK